MDDPTQTIPASSETNDPRSTIDEMMERASRALEDTQYFDAERWGAEALRRAHAARLYERMSRIVMPLLEARRQIRQLAIDNACQHPEPVRVASRESDLGHLDSGCVLLQPPMIGADARSLRELTRTRRVPVVLLTREPMTRKGLWPVVAVGGSIILRTQVQPPEGVEPGEGMTRDRITAPITMAWYEGAIEALGDSAIASVPSGIDVDPTHGEPAAHRVEDFLDRVEALPEHEKLHQRLVDACRLAMHEPEPAFRRRRGIADDPYSF